MFFAHIIKYKLIKLTANTSKLITLEWKQAFFDNKNNVKFLIKLNVQSLCKQV